MRYFLWTILVVGALITSSATANVVSSGDKAPKGAEYNTSANTDALNLVRGGGDRKSVRQHRSGGGGDRKAVRHHRSGGDRKAVRQHRSGGDRKAVRQHRSGGDRKAFRHHRSGGDRKAFRHHRSGGDRKAFRHHRRGGEKRYHARRGHHRERAWHHERRRGDRYHARRGHHKDQFARWNKGDKEKNENWKNGYYRNHKNGYYRKGKGSREGEENPLNVLDSGEVLESEGTLQESVTDIPRQMRERAQDRVVDGVMNRILPQ